MTLRGLPTRPVLATSTDRIVRDFYVPALRASVGYDRGVGYFTSAWLRLAAEGLAALAASGGHARIVASPVLEASDWAALKRGVEAQADPRLLDALRRPLGELADSLATDTLVAIAWMIADGLLEFKLALPVDDLDGDFHDKFGVFRDSAGDEVAFHGSQNDSAKAFRNYESIDVFYSWLDAREAERVRLHGDRFKRIWANTEPNLVVVDLPESIRHELVEYAQRGERPYRLPTALLESRKWRHQQEALDRFLACGHGVLEMATGTGKTRTALAILNHLQREQRINTAVVAAFGTDLLDQWYQQLRAHTGLLVFRVYGEHK